ncbi:MAG TPA: glutamate--cysteine ligase [Allocoleopsis sp.]
MLLSKGFEVEIYTGTPTGDIIGFADQIVANLDGFVREPDSRNVEYTTAPFTDYDRLLCALVLPRVKLRKYLKKLGDYTLIPGSTLSLGGSDRFHRSDPNNPYHDYIENTYGTNVVTASIHINIGINDPEFLILACRLIRLEAPLYLALSASSPFLDGKITGYHSTRWQMFPKTPQIVPLFENHHHFITWTNEQLELKTMQNVRHLWSSVRPNGINRPYNVNRLELRICDLVVEPIQLLAITALLEGRLLQLMCNSNLDPLVKSEISPKDLIKITDKNEENVAKNSLDAELIHWQDGRKIIARDWIEELYEEVWFFTKKNGFSCFLSPIKKILREGNTAMNWLKATELGLTSREVIIDGIKGLEEQERELEDKLCQEILV